jgi:hypothetical protein
VLLAQAGDPTAIERLFREVSPFVEGLVRARGVRAGDSVRDHASGTLQIFMDDNRTPRLTVAVDLGTLLSLDDSRAFVGFTAGTGTATEDHDILNWSFTESPAKAVPEPSTFVLLCTGFLGVFGYCRRRERIQG